jgi:hypothetical protein
MRHRGAPPREPLAHDTRLGVPSCVVDDLAVGDLLVRIRGPAQEVPLRHVLDPGAEGPDELAMADEQRAP